MLSVAASLFLYVMCYYYLPEAHVRIMGEEMIQNFVQWFKRWREKNGKQGLIRQVRDINFQIRHHKNYLERYLRYRVPDEIPRSMRDAVSKAEIRINDLEQEKQRLLSRLDTKTRKSLLDPGPLCFHDQAPSGA